MDAHFPTSTVREALMFSASLRLAATVTEEQRVSVVDETMRLLELEQCADWVVSTLSAGQAKRLTIGVERACGCCRCRCTGVVVTVLCDVPL